MAQPAAPLTSLEVMQRMAVEPRCWGGGGCLPHSLQLTTGLVINSSVTTSPTLVSIRKNVFWLKQNFIFLFCAHRSRLAGSCFLIVDYFSRGWKGSFYSWKLLSRLVLPDARAVGAGLPGLPGSCHCELLPPSLSGQAATTVALLLHALGWPGFL